MDHETSDAQENLHGHQVRIENRDQFLIKEYEILKDLYVQSHNDTQSIFNFYITLMTAASGGIIVLSQIAPNKNIMAIPFEIVIASFLAFTVVFGAITVSTLAARYGNLARYGQTIDELRRWIISQNDIGLPPLYDEFLEKTPAQQPYLDRILPRIFSWLKWIYPTGAYHFFVVVVSGASAATAVWLLWKQLGITIAIFFAVFFLLNLLSRRVRYYHVTRSIMSVDIHR